MKKTAKYSDAIVWIAEDPTHLLFTTAADFESALTVHLVADLFDRDVGDVARAVMRARSSSITPRRSS